MTQEFFIIDAFTSVPFKGNAAGVCIMDEFPDASVMQMIALHMYLSETAFVVPCHPERSEGSLQRSFAKAQDDKYYDLRWFTPETEVPLCGHATLASAHALLQTKLIKDGDTVTFNTLSGPLKAQAKGKVIEMDFPTLPGKPVKAPAALNALGVEILACEKNRDKYLVEVKDFDTLVACKPAFNKLKKLDAEGVIVTTATGVKGYDFASRFFCPGIGIDEDPVTGSAHCFLAPYWAKKLGKNTFHAYQASKGQGVLDVTLKGERTLIAGSAVTTLKGTLPTITKGKAA